MSSFREKLIQKVFRRERYVRTHVRSSKGGALDQYDKMNQQEEKIDASNKIERVLRKVKRRLDRSFGFAVEAKLPPMSSRQKVSVARVSYMAGHAIQLTMANSSINEWEGFQVGDIAVILDGHLKGKNLAVVNIPDSSHLLLEDVASYIVPAVAASFTGQVAGMTTNVTITANTAGAAGNSISLSFDGSTSVSAEIAAWNIANPSNQATLTSGNGAQVPNNLTSINLSGGSNSSALTESNIIARLNINGSKRSYV